MALLKQSTARNRSVLMIQAADHVTGLAGATLTITAQKDGGAAATITPTVTDRGNGFYSLALTTAHTDTLGDLAFHITATGGDPTDFIDQVLAALPGELTASTIDLIHDEVVEGTTTFRESMRIANAANGGKLSGAATSTVPIRDLADTKNRLTWTVDADGNRLAVTRDLT